MTGSKNIISPDLLKELGGKTKDDNRKLGLAFILVGEIGSLREYKDRVIALLGNSRFHLEFYYVLTDEGPRTVLFRSQCTSPDMKTGDMIPGRAIKLKEVRQKVHDVITLLNKSEHVDLILIGRPLLRPSLLRLGRFTTRIKEVKNLHLLDNHCPAFLQTLQGLRINHNIKTP